MLSKSGSHLLLNLSIFSLKLVIIAYIQQGTSHRIWPIGKVHAGGIEGLNDIFSKLALISVSR